MALTDQDIEGAGGRPMPNRAQRRGYVRQRKIYKLVFEDEDMAGLEVRARSVPLGTLMELIGLASVVEGGSSDRAKLNGEELEAARKLFAGFGDALVSWNLEEPVVDADGEETGETQPVPATVEGLYSQDMDFVLRVIQAWMEAVAGASGPLGQRSGGGKPSLEASLPMAPSSPSPPS